MNVKEIIPKIKEAAAKVSAKSRRAILIGGAAVLVFAVVFAVLINRKDYTVLYSAVNAEEATEIVSKLQESGVAYQYKDNGDVLVDKKQVDKVRAQLAQAAEDFRADPTDTSVTAQMQSLTEKLEQYQRGLALLHSGTPMTITAGKIPDAHICFLDEIFKADRKSVV